MGWFLMMLVIIGFVVAALIHDKQNNPDRSKRQRITRI